MAVPGFSVSDLIQALGQVKIVYDAFFNEYTNTASQVRDLADDIEQFRKNLQKHKEIVEQNGLEYSGYEAVQRTLDSCYRFLDEYKEVLDRRRRKSVVGAFKTARFAFEQEEVSRLRNQIAGHKSDILHYSVNIVLENSLRSSERSSPRAIPRPVANVGRSSHSTSPPATPLLGSPLLPQEQFAPQSARRAVSSNFEDAPIAQVSESPRISHSLSSQVFPIPQSPTNVQSPSQTGRSIAQTGLSIPGLVLPQSALSYRVAEVYFDNKKVDLKRKAAGRDFGNGREMVIMDEAGSLRFQHRIKLSRNELCFPYTWHRRWRKDHNTLEIGFIGTAPEAHAISFKGGPAISAIPTYVFAQQKDFEDFQSELRGKHLEASFEVRQIYCASSSRNGEATDQHLKFWRDYSTHELSLSFYASAVPKPRHIEFPLGMFDLQPSTYGEVEVCMNFVGYGEAKRARTFSKAFSRSPTEGSTSSTSTTVPGIFTRNNTNIISSAASATTANSRMSVASFKSDNSTSQSERSKTVDPIGIQAKTMKYLRIEFSDQSEASRFKQEHARLCQEEVSRPSDLFLSWQINAGQRAESVVSTSPSGTPFTMSPELRPIRNQAAN